MKMLKKLALVLLVSSSCGIQAMDRGLEVSRWNVGAAGHFDQHSEMYDSPSGGMQEDWRLKVEYTPERIAQMRAEEEETQMAERATNNRLGVLARRQGVTKGDLEGRLTSMLARDNDYRRENGDPDKTLDEILTEEEDRETQRKVTDAEIAKELERANKIDFARAQRMSPAEKAAQKAEQERTKFISDFKAKYYVEHPDQYELFDDGITYYSGLKSEYEAVFNAALKAAELARK